MLTLVQSSTKACTFERSRDALPKKSKNL